MQHMSQIANFCKAIKSRSPKDQIAALLVESDRAGWDDKFAVKTLLSLRAAHADKALFDFWAAHVLNSAEPAGRREHDTPNSEYRHENLTIPETSLG